MHAYTEHRVRYWSGSASWEDQPNELVPKKALAPRRFATSNVHRFCCEKLPADSLATSWIMAFVRVDGRWEVNRLTCPTILAKETSLAVAVQQQPFDMI